MIPEHRLLSQEAKALRSAVSDRALLFLFFFFSSVCFSGCEFQSLRTLVHVVPGGWAQFAPFLKKNRA